MLIRNLSNAMSNVYGVVTYAATHPKETIAAVGLITVLGLTGCGGNADNKTVMLHNLVSSQTPKEGVKYEDMGNWGVRTKVVIDGVTYWVYVGDRLATGGKGYGAMSIWHGDMLLSKDVGRPGSNPDGRLDGKVDSGASHGQEFNRFTNQNPNLEEELQRSHDESLDTLIRFFEN